MPGSEDRILVAGGTGNIGAPLLRLLAGRGVPLRALMRDPAKEPKAAAWMQEQGIEIVAGDLAGPASLDRAFAAIDRGFLLTPVSREQVAWKSNFIQAAKRAGVKHIVNLSVAGAAANSPLILGRWHWESEQELERSGIAWTHLRPYDLAQYNTKLFLSTVLKDGVFASTAGEGKVAMVDERDVAAVAAEALLDPARAGQAYTLTGPEALSYSEIAEAITKQLGRPVRYLNVTADAAKQAMLAQGLPEWLADFINDLRRFESQGGASAVTSDVQQVTGRPATRYAESLRSALAAG